MKSIQIAGVVGLSIGAILVGFAYHGWNAPVNQIADTLTGRFADRTMWYLCLGIAATLGGALPALFGNRIELGEFSLKPATAGA